MPPDADTLRQRNSKLHKGSELVSNDTTTTVRSLQSLKTNEVCIDGIIYDINSFYHPGGASIHVFGGNDVTVQYKMIHPYHTDKHLEKMTKVGKVADYVPEYKFDTPFAKEVKKEVFKIVHRGREFATPGYLVRAVMYVSLYAILQYTWITQGSSWKLAMLYGVAQALIGLNVQHDGNHGAVSGKYPWMNNLLGLGADFIGGSKWLWMEQHWTHHAFCNHQEKDPDALSGEPIFLWTDYAPDHPKRRWWHNFQGLYYMFVLSFYWLSEVFNPQIFDLKQSGAMSAGIKMDSPYLVNRRGVAVTLRMYYIFVHVVLPCLHHGVGFRALGDIAILASTESLALAILFSLSHNFEHSDRDPMQKVDTTDGLVDWYKAQAETSCTYGGFLSGCLTGGLNFQVEHHLFPRMSSAWYPYIAPTVRKVCKAHGVRYAYYPWMIQNLISTFKYMSAAGTGSNWKDGNPYSGKL